MFIINLMAELHKIDSKQFRNPFDKWKTSNKQFNGPLKLCALIDLCNSTYILLLVTIIMELTKIVVLVL